jgi:hypothetical protein
MPLQSMTIAQSELVALLGAEKVLLATDCLVGLFTSNIAITPQTTLAALAALEPVGSWYARIAGAAGDVYLNDDGSLSITIASVEFDYSGSDPAEIITGYFVVRAASPVLVGARLLDQAVTMQNALDAVIVQPTITVPPILAA